MKPLEPIHPLTEYTSFFIHEYNGLHTIYAKYGEGAGCDALGETFSHKEAYRAIKDFVRLIQATRQLEGLPFKENFPVGYIRE